MYYLKKIITIIIFTVHVSFCQLETSYYKRVDLSSGLFSNEIQLQYFNDGYSIGFLSYTKVPVFSIYILHSLIVYPEFRNRGYGRKLLEYALFDLKKAGASRVYIQPGPFEISGKELSESEHDQKIKSLVKFYASFGFEFVYKLTSIIMRIAYFFAGIDENPNYLMVKQIS